MTTHSRFRIAFACLFRSSAELRSLMAKELGKRNPKAIASLAQGGYPPINRKIPPRLGSKKVTVSNFLKDNPWPPPPDSVAKTFNTVSTVPGAENPFVATKPADISRPKRIKVPPARP